MNRYLSFGGGINSVSLLLLLRDQGVEFEAVWADHGADYPETQEYVRMLQARGYPITVLKTGDLWGKCVKYRVMPSRWQRWCTQDFKVKPLRAYFQRPAVVYLGIDADEPQRIKPSGLDDLEHVYPLFDEGLDRKACARIITEHGLPLPGKSTCWFCPFQRGAQWRELRTKHPDLFCRAAGLERLVSARIGKPVYLSNAEKPLDVVAMSDQYDLWGERQVTPCLCEL